MLTENPDVHGLARPGQTADHQLADRVLDVNILNIRRRFGYYGSIVPVMAIIRGADAQASVNFTTPFFRADRAYELLDVYERHEVAATDGTFTLNKVPSGTAPSAGTALLAAALSLTTTANTDQRGVVSTKLISTGDSLAIVPSGLLTSLIGVTVSVLLRAI